MITVVCVCQADEEQSYHSYYSTMQSFKYYGDMPVGVSLMVFSEKYGRPTMNVSIPLMDR